MMSLHRFGQSVARSLLYQQHRHMASTTAANDPIQRLFVDKIREAKTSSTGLDEAHQKQMNDEMLRLKRVYNVEDESKLTNLDHKFPSESDVSLHDISTAKEMRAKIHSGEYQRQLAAAPKPVSALLATTPDQTPHEFCLPPLNKPDPSYLFENSKPLQPMQISGVEPDYVYQGSNMTPERLEAEMLVKFGDQMPTIHDDDAPQRDKVNFPRQPPSLDCPPTRYHIIPENWFQFFYPKTGVTGPYAFVGAFGAFLMSKEWLVMEHELLTAFSSICIFAYALPKFGPKVKEFLVKEIKVQTDGWDNWQKGNVEALGKMVNHYKDQLTLGSDVIGEIYAARKQDVELQMEFEYRRRLKSVYDDTKRRLNYLVAVADSQRQIHHSNMVNTVISNVINSFGPKQENEVLDDCVINLKRLAAKNANSI